MLGFVRLSCISTQTHLDEPERVDIRGPARIVTEKFDTVVTNSELYCRRIHSVTAASILGFIGVQRVEEPVAVLRTLW